MPEKASDWEFGTNLLRNDLLIAGDKARVKLAYFHNVTDDYIGRRWDDTKVSDAYLTLFNYDKVIMSGVELRAAMTSGKPSSISRSTTRPRQLVPDGKHLHPRHRAG